MLRNYFSILFFCLVDVWVYVLKVLIYPLKINYVYLAIQNVGHVEMLVKIVVSVVNLVSFLYMIQWFVLNLVLIDIILVREYIKFECKWNIWFNQIVDFENVYVVKLIVHHVKRILIYVHHVQMVMLLKIWIV